MELCSLGPYKGALPTSCPSPAREAPMLLHMTGKANQYLVNKMTSITKNQLRPIWRCLIQLSDINLVFNRTVVGQSRNGRRQNEFFNFSARIDACQRLHRRPSRPMSRPSCPSHIRGQGLPLLLEGTPRQGVQLDRGPEVLQGDLHGPRQPRDQG